MDKVLANAEIKTMIHTFGCGFSEGYGNDFDISKLKYNKIVIMTDADVDGAHIATLLLTFFYRFMPDLIHQGHVYLATPPLYKAIPKRGKEEYLYDDRALENYRKNHKSNFTLQRFKGLGEISPDEFKEFIGENMRLDKVRITKDDPIHDLLEFYMGKNTYERQGFIIDNLRIEEDIVEQDLAIN